RAAVVAVGPAEIRETERTPFLWRGEINAQVPATIQMRIAYFPGWTVRLDGQRVEPKPSTPTGLLTFQAPPGTHRAEVRWENTAPRTVGNAISLASLVLLLAGAWWGAAPKRETKEAT